jgi:hypothetical protein
MSVDVKFFLLIFRPNPFSGQENILRLSLFRTIARKKLPFISVLALLILSPLLSASASASSGGSATGVTPGVDPPLNAAALYAISGNYNYQAAGAAMRDQGYGTITLTWTGTLVKAYLIWAIIDGYGSTTSQPATAADDAGEINGNPITGVLQSSDFSPCWPGYEESPSYANTPGIWVYAADVTSHVVSGANSLTGFQSADTSGGNPWSDEFVTPAAEGATLVVVTTGTTANQVYIYTGSYTDPYAGDPISSTFNHGTSDATSATTTFIVADGQYANNYAVWNGVTVDSNAFPGSDPKASSATWSYGNLWDTKTYSVAIALGSTSETAQIGGSSTGTPTPSDDCITWAGQVLSIPSIVPIVGAPEFNVPASIFAPLLAVLLIAIRPLLLRKLSSKM